MCLVLKLDNGKVVSIANEQTESCQHPVPYYNIDLLQVALLRSWVSMFCVIIECLFAGDPLVGSIATQFLQNSEEHDRIARLWTKRYAT